LILPPELFQSIWTSHGDEFATISSQRHWIQHCRSLRFFLFEIELLTDQCHLWNVTERDGVLANRDILLLSTYMSQSGRFGFSGMGMVCHHCRTKTMLICDSQAITMFTWWK
jgi:hypothetical protein